MSGCWAGTREAANGRAAAGLKCILFVVVVFPDTRGRAFHHGPPRPFFPLCSSALGEGFRRESFVTRKTVGTEQP